MAPFSNRSRFASHSETNAPNEPLWNGIVVAWGMVLIVVLAVLAFISELGV